MSYVCEKVKKQIQNQENTVSRICHLTRVAVRLGQAQILGPNPTH